MKKVWKWIIGIVAALLVIALVVGAFFLVHSHVLLRGVANDWVRPGFGMRGQGVTPYFDGGRGGYGMNHGMMGFGFPFGGFLGWLLPIGFVALVVAGIVLLVKAFSKPAVPAQPELHCKNCNYSVQAGWRNCPNCGKKL